MERKYPYALIFSISIFIALGLIRTLVAPLNFWVDEMFHVFAAQGILTTGQPLLPSDLPYDRSLITTLLVAGSFQVLGVSEFAARLPFIFIGAGAVLASYLLAKEIFDRRVATVTALLLAISPWQVYWSTNARMYILLQLAYVVFLYFLYRSWAEWKRDGGINRTREGYPPGTCWYPGYHIVLLADIPLQFYKYKNNRGGLFIQRTLNQQIWRTHA